MKCKCPECTRPATIDYPTFLCDSHIELWDNWNPNSPMPYWMEEEPTHEEMKEWYSVDRH
jgi:hypothetical protein